MDISVFVTDTPAYDDVLAARAERQAMVRDYLATVTAEMLAEPRRNPWAPEHEESVLACLHTILEEEWEHHRYAVRDLAVLEASRRRHRSGAGRGSRAQVGRAPRPSGQRDAPGYVDRSWGTVIITGTTMAATASRRASCRRGCASSWISATCSVGCRRSGSGRS